MDRNIRSTGDFPLLQLYTIGHSTHPIEHFLGLLTQHGIKVVADIRRFPSSRKFPQFNQVELTNHLRNVGLEYQWIEALGGRRPHQSVGPDLSKNLGLRNASFRNYADYMATQEFRDGVECLLKVATGKRTAYMCSESLFWRCHRRLVSDYLLMQGFAVRHIMPNGELRDHTLTVGAKIVAGELTYPSGDAKQTEFTFD